MARLEPLLGNSPDPAQITFSEFLCFNVIRVTEIPRFSVLPLLAGLL